jgi:type III secretion system chaperone SycN
MSAPAWLESLVRDFGKGAGLPDFALNERGAAALSFENGATLRFEYDGEALAVAMTVPCRPDPAKARAILACAHPDARYGLRVRAGYLARRGTAVFAVRLEERAVTLPLVNQAFAVLWRIALETGGAA